MAVGWARDGAVQEQIDAGIDDAVKLARSRLPKGESLAVCQACEEDIPEARQKAIPGVRLCIACQSEIEEPPINDHWTVVGEESQLPKWQQEDADFFKAIKATEYYHQLQIDDFLAAINEKRDPLVTGQEGRKTVELFTAVYRSQRDKKSIQFPLLPEADNRTFDGRYFQSLT